MFWYNIKFKTVKIKKAISKIKHFILNDSFFLCISLSLYKETFLPFFLKMFLIVEFAISAITTPKIMPTKTINRYEYGK